ncbi:GntR family transcriptional regulator [Streptomyces sp. SHP22-7]|nr:GntR family transcriptional regulator [Streptomyces sp. SHP22-7]RIH58541.1 GntR family transcriptional regulator [Streptomyces sp. SHP22-7]
MATYRDVADELRRRIELEQDEYRPGDELPTIERLQEQFGLSKQTIRSAIRVLADEGLVSTGRGRPARVRDNQRIRIPFSRYGGVMTPGGASGPWESACAEQGIDGRMKTVTVDTRPIGQADAALLGVPPGSDVVYRRRHACVGDDVLQVQQAWYPRPVALQAGLTTTRKIEGGVYGALTASGMAPSELDETIRGRMPTADEAELLHTGTGVPLLTVERVTRGSDGQPLELLRVTAPADRIEFVYNNLPLPSGGTA